LWDIRSLRVEVIFSMVFSLWFNYVEMIDDFTPISIANAVPMRYHWKQDRANRIWFKMDEKVCSFCVHPDDMSTG